MLAAKRSLFCKYCSISQYSVAMSGMFCKMTSRLESVTDQPTFTKRNIHSSVALTHNIKLMKMLAKKKKKLWYENTRQPPAHSHFDFLKPTRKNREDSARVRTLNSIIYKAVTDLLASYELNAQIPSYNIQISKVSLSADFSACRIYWRTSLSAEEDCNIQQLLEKCAPRVRYLLISQQILGSVPPVVFIRDRQYAAIMEVEKLLKVADYGPDEDTQEHFPRSDFGVGLEQSGTEAESRKKPVLFGVDHEALHKQIEAYKRDMPQRDSFTHISSGGLTQEQTDLLANIRKQKLVEKKKLKSRRLKDDDITPKEFLLSRSLQTEEPDEENRENTLLEMSQLMVDDKLGH